MDYLEKKVQKNIKEKYNVFEAYVNESNVIRLEYVEHDLSN